MSINGTNKEVIFVNGFEMAKMQYTYFIPDGDEYVDNKGELSEQTFIKFSYPYFIMVKGSLEIICYSFLHDTFYYEKLNCPIMCGLTNAVDNFEDRNKAYVLFDVGDYYLICTIQP